MFGIGKAIKKGFKKVAGFVGKATGLSHVFKAAKGIWDDLTGKTAAKDMAKTQEAQLRQQRETAKLEASNEIGNVTQFDETVDSSFVGAGARRRKKKSVSSYASGLGLSI